MGAPSAARSTAGPPAETVTAALADWEESAWEVAVTPNFGGLGMVAGGAYNPAVVMVPKVAFGSPAGNPFTLHSTLELLVPITVAANCWLTGHCALFKFSAAVTGETATPMVTVTLAEADFVLSAWAMAVMVTFAGVGGAEGAV